MTEHINTWKNKEIFQEQLGLNKLQLDNNYPPHWSGFLSLMKTIEDKKNLLDVGCGCGSFYSLCKKEFSNLGYFGIDYSEDAINLAKSEFCKDSFEVKDVNDLTKEYINKFDVFVMNGLLACLPNGDEVLENFLKLGPKNLIVSRINFTDSKSHYNVYQAYDKIKTYEFHHNRENFDNILKKYGYTCIETAMWSQTLLIQKI